MPSPRILEQISLTAYLALFLLLMAWIGWLSPPTQVPVVLVLVVLVGPLLLPLPAVLRGHRKAKVLLCYLSMFYFGHGLSEWYATPSDRVLAQFEILFSLSLYLSLFIYLRKTRPQ